MRNLSALVSITMFVILALILFKNGELVPRAEAGKRRIEITDNLEDVIDDEEDEAWKEWGKKKTSAPEFDPPPSDLNKMDISEIQAQMMKRTLGPVFGFVKLTFGARRTPEIVSEIAMKWSKVLRTAAMEVKFWGVDLSTIMFNMEAGQDMIELKEFILDQPEAYEVKIGDQVFRRPGDPPLQTVLEKLHNEKNEADEAEDDSNHKEEL